MVDWGDDGILPCQVHCFVDLHKREGDLELGGVANGPGIYAIAEAARENDDPDENEMSTMFTPYIKECTIQDDGTIKRELFLVDVEAFHDTACIIPDIGNDNKQAYLRVMPRSEWSDCFSRWIRAPHTRDFAEME